MLDSGNKMELPFQLVPAGCALYGLFFCTAYVELAVKNFHAYCVEIRGWGIGGHFQNTAFGRPQCMGAFFRFSVRRYWNNSRWCWLWVLGIYWYVGSAGHSGYFRTISRKSSQSNSSQRYDQKGVNVASEMALFRGMSGTQSCLQDQMRVEDYTCFIQAKNVFVMAVLQNSPSWLM